MMRHFLLFLSGLCLVATVAAAAKPQKRDISQMFGEFSQSDSVDTGAFYARFLFTPDNYVAYRLATPKTGTYRVLIGANTFLEAKFASLLRVFITDSQRKSVDFDYAVQETAGRVALILLFEGPKRRVGGDVFLQLRVDSEQFNALSSADKRFLREQVVGEISFDRLE